MYVLLLSVITRTRNDTDLEETAKLGPHFNVILKDISALKIRDEATSLPSNPKPGLNAELGSLRVADYIGMYGVKPNFKTASDSDSDATYPPMPGLVSDSDSDSSDHSEQNSEKIR